MDFTGLFGKTYQISFTRETIVAAFHATEVYPFDHSVITENKCDLVRPRQPKVSLPSVIPAPYEPL